MTGLLKIGELAKQTGLSVRTLHYYDEIALLVPSHRSEAEHRLYSDRDIMRLQQILSLRQLGLSLSDIRDCLEDPAYTLPQVIDLHRDRLREQISLSHTLLNRLNGIAKEIETTESVAVENLIQTMETINMSTQYFTPEQQAVLDTRFRKGEAEWQTLLNEIRSEMQQGSDLNSPAVRMLARRWLWSMRSFVQGDAEIYESLISMYQQEGNVAAEWGMDSATFDYILKAIFSLALGDVTEAMIPTHRIFTAQTKEVMRLGEIPIREINFDVLGTEGVLLGILAEGKSAAAQALRSLDVTYEAVLPIVVKWLGTRPTPPEGTFPATLPFAPRVKRVIEIALEEAKQREQARISPEHLLVAILEEYKEVPPPGGVATYVLREEMDVDLGQLEQMLRSATGATVS
ncbi:MAG: MerR family transcriptional regulator [Cyanobacteria bacterium J06560_6]